METPEYFHEGRYCAATPQMATEKHGKGGGDNFIVEDLLDLTKEEEEDVGMADNGFGAAVGISSTDSSTVTAADCGVNSVSGGRESHFPGELVCRGLDDAGLSGDLCEPYEELAELEWLSNFVEESFSSEDLQKQNLISGFKYAASSAAKGDDSTSASAATGGVSQPSFCLPEAPVPGKARSKRSRIPPCNWSSRLLLVSSVSLSSSSESEPTLIQPNPGKKAAKKKEPALAGAPAYGRKCLHCATDKTPQWRTGPMGPKTLCNACGVRYKSGRLVPEYRPAASPTFVLSKHSNSHRKVLELRRQKEREQQQFLQASCGATGTGFFDGSPEAAGDDFLIHHYLGPDFRQLI